MQYQKLLAVIDPDREQQKALIRAIHLAEKSAASVTAFLSIYDFSYEMTTMLSIEERESMRQAVIEDRTAWLTDMLQDYSNSNIAIDVKVVWHNRPFEAILHEALEGNYELILKGTHQHDKLKSVIFTPTDWHLMRKSHIPVLLVKEHAWPDNGQILAAINAGTEDQDHQSLNEKISQNALHFCQVLNASTHFVNSFPGTPVNIAIEIPEFDPQSYNESVKKHHEAAMLEHANRYHVPGENCHVNEGLPEDVIPQVANEIDAELVIIGTVGRQGLSAALIGNTAEHVIDMLDCDVLAVKPEGFTSPLLK